MPLSASDCFVLASSYEGWANVLLEAMACGLPVIATDVGGNAQVVNSDELGRIVPLGNAKALESSLLLALKQPWDRGQIRAYAESNTWDRRIPKVIDVLERVVGRKPVDLERDARMTAGSHAE